MKTLLIFLFAAFALSAAAYAQSPPIEKGVSNELAKWRGANYSEIKYKLDLTLEKMSPVLKGSAEISLLSKGDLIIFDWRKLAGKEDLSKISNLSVNGRKAYFEEINGHLVLKEGVLKNKSNTIKFDFTSPIAETGTAVTRYVDKTDNTEYVYFLSNNTISAFPVFDQPDLKARLELSVIAPNEWYAVSNTSSQESFLIEENGLGFGGRKNATSTGNKIIEFEETKPISKYLFAFAAGDFIEFDEILKGKIAREITKEEFMKLHQQWTNRQSLKVYVRKSKAEKFKQYAEKVFRDNQKNKSAASKLDIILLPEFPSVQSDYEGLKFLSESSVFR